MARGTFPSLKIYISINYCNITKFRKQVVSSLVRDFPKNVHDKTNYFSLPTNQFNGGREG